MQDVHRVSTVDHPDAVTEAADKFSKTCVPKLFQVTRTKTEKSPSYTDGPESLQNVNVLCLH